MASKKARYEHQNITNNNHIRVRPKRLGEVDSTKLTLAYWLLAKQLVEDKTDPRELSEAEVRKVLDRLETEGDDAAKLRPNVEGSGA